MRWIHACRVAAVAGAALASTSTARAATYRVGPGQPFSSLLALTEILLPGDLVEVVGDATYHGDFLFRKPGLPDAKITIRGVRVGGRRPVLAGGDFLVELHADHYVLEGFEVTGGASACIFVAADDITVRDTVVHDCPRHGILAADDESGSQTYEYVELFRNGYGEYKHQMYIATDEALHPGSVLRVEHSYFHDGNGGNNLKSRAERNEIRSNWIEGAVYHELDLIGPDGAPEHLAREDSDVVGNVLVKSSTWYVARLGGDGTGETNGRYRFASNTILVAPGAKAAIYLQDGIESLELSNNVFVQPGGAGAEIVRDGSASWSTGVPRIAGIRNWVGTACAGVPAGLEGTLRGEDPRFVDLLQRDVRPAADSPLVDAAAFASAPPAGLGVPSPLLFPLYLPPPRRLEPVGTAALRLSVGEPDIGSYERGNPGEGSMFGDGRGCTCVGSETVERDFPPLAGAFVMLVIPALGRRRGRRRRRAIAPGRWISPDGAGRTSPSSRSSRS